MIRAWKNFRYYLPLETNEVQKIMLLFGTVRDIFTRNFSQGCSCEGSCQINWNVKVGGVIMRYEMGQGREWVQVNPDIFDPHHSLRGSFLQASMSSFVIYRAWGEALKIRVVQWCCVRRVHNPSANSYYYLCREGGPGICTLLFDDWWLITRW